MVIDTNKIKAKILEKGLTQEKVADLIGINKNTFYAKMAKKRFNSDEMFIMQKILEFEDPTSVFFANDLTCGVKNEILS